MRLGTLIVLVGLATPLTGGCDKILPQRPKTAFSGTAALGYAAAQVKFGPRVPGTAAAKQAGDWIVAQMKTRADTVVVQEWVHTTVKGEKLPMRNVLARFKPQAKDRVLYLTHWDTRPIADSDPVFGKRVSSFDAANDGAAGVGLFVALADLLKKTPPSVGVDLLFVDGEDWGDFNAPGGAPDVLIGSTYFTQHLPEPGYKPIYGVLWDMIGDKDLGMRREGNSMAAAPEVVNRVWQTAADLGYQKYFIAVDDQAITDDHVPFLKAGIHVIDVIDFDYTDQGQNLHHTSMDTMDKISAASLQIVGDVAAKLVL